MPCRYGKWTVAMVALALLPGCAALINGPTQDIAVNSDPPGAHCMMTRENAVIATVPQTPAIVRVNRSPADIVVDCRHEGHGHGRHRMKSSADGVTLGNIVGAGLMGVGIDSATHADKAYDSSITVPVSPQNVPAPDSTAESRKMAQAAPTAVGDVSQASWIAQRTAATNASNQVPTAPVGYVPPQPLKRTEAPAEVKPAATAPAPPVAPAPAPAPASKPQPPQPAPSKSVATAKASPPSAGSGLWHAHLASHRTEGAAINEWQELLKRDPKLYGDFDPRIEWVDVKDRGSFARLLVGGWPERKEADAACARIRGPQRYCAVVRE